MLKKYLNFIALMYIIYKKSPKLFSEMVIAIRAILAGHDAGKDVDTEQLDEAIEFTGYAYDPDQDIYYSILDPWQRKYGYCHLYDEISAPWGMIMDCEPMFFEYDNKKWMVSVWKGQYDLTTGCEIGVYVNDDANFKLTELITGTFYNCPSNEDLLQMSCTLMKNGEKMFNREEKQWWLTGFKLGEYSEPEQLTMDVKITFKDEIMAGLYVKELKKAGYKAEEITVEGSTVSFVFDKPKTAQPLTREKNFDSIIQWKNKLMCDSYQEITKDYDNMEDKLKALKEQAPDLYNKILHIRRIGKASNVFAIIQLIEAFMF